VLHIGHIKGLIRVLEIKKQRGCCNGKSEESFMKIDQSIINKYKLLLKEGLSADQLFDHAKKEGYKSFECVKLIMSVFTLTLEQARLIAYDYYVEHKKITEKE
jgi:hypothetical protein